mgnify:CR=1 FL=1|tara:strand:+ start:673 stop:1053 length:381 start_codon:yes stop_codon:yes gene_type:complete
MIGNFVSPVYKQLNINQLALPLEICDLIQSYLFYNKESITFIKKISSNKLELTLIKKAWTRTNSSGLTPDSSNWIWGFTHENDPYQKEYLQMQGENCPSCGEYKYISYSTNPHLHSKLSICFCSDN